MIRVLLVGATGSIGQSTLACIRALGPDSARLVGAFAGSDAEGLSAVAAEFGVRFAGLADPARVPEVAASLPGVRTGTLADLLEDAVGAATVVVNAVTGAAGLPTSIAAVSAGKTLALANKESMVLAGPQLMELAKEHGARILPVDSEHSAIFQCLHAGRPSEVKKLILTASGGPFRTFTAEQIAQATPEQALQHPIWKMGPKITIDSATMMNKALEVIEARWLFDVEPESIEVAVHPQSVVHSMVEFVDGSIVAQMGQPDMRLPIQYALTYPERRGPGFSTFSFDDFRSLTFEPPDRDRFPALAIGERAARLGGTAGAIVNAANEVAVQQFLDGAIPFPAIAETVARVLDDAEIIATPTLNEIDAADQAAREDAASAASDVRRH
ncbi:MAG: 1-deoxy-D-xylulose-5-phosphate reductoisomerase [Planctomycetota bacterium]